MLPCCTDVLSSSSVVSRGGRDRGKEAIPSQSSLQPHKRRSRAEAVHTAPEPTPVQTYLITQHQRPTGRQLQDQKPRKSSVSQTPRKRRGSGASWGTRGKLSGAGAAWLVCGAEGVVPRRRGLHRLPGLAAPAGVPELRACQVAVKWITHLIKHPTAA